EVCTDELIARGRGREVRINQVRAAGKRVGGGELELRGVERALGGLDRHEMSVQVGESRALAVVRHGHIGGAEAKDDVTRSGSAAIRIGSDGADEQVGK